MYSTQLYYVDLIIFYFGGLVQFGSLLVLLALFIILISNPVNQKIKFYFKIYLFLLTYLKKQIGNLQRNMSNKLLISLKFF